MHTLVAEKEPGGVLCQCVLCVRMLFAILLAKALQKYAHPSALIEAGSEQNASFGLLDVILDLTFLGTAHLLGTVHLKWGIIYVQIQKGKG